MNRTNLSALADIVGSIGVVVTLIYVAMQTERLARQTKQNTVAIVSNSRQQSLNAELQLLRMIVDYPVTGLSYEAATDQDGLRRQRAVDLAFFRIREQQWFQFRDDQLDQATWQSYSNPRIAQRWKQSSSIGYAPRFVSAVNEALAG